MSPRPTTRELALLGAFAIFFLFTSSARAPNAALDRGRSHLASTANSKGVNWPWTGDSTSYNNPPQSGYLEATHRTWDRLPPETQILAHRPGSYIGLLCLSDGNKVYNALGFTMFDNLYSFNNTLFVVTSDPSSVPKRDSILSAGLPLGRNEYICLPLVCQLFPNLPLAMYQEGTRSE